MTVREPKVTLLPGTSLIIYHNYWALLRLAIILSVAPGDTLYNIFIWGAKAIRGSERPKFLRLCLLLFQLEKSCLGAWSDTDYSRLIYNIKCVIVENHINHYIICFFAFFIFFYLSPSPFSLFHFFFSLSLLYISLPPSPCIYVLLSPPSFFSFSSNRETFFFASFLWLSFIVFKFVLRAVLSMESKTSEFSPPLSYSLMQRGRQDWCGGN